MPQPEFAGFSPSLLKFLRDLSRNNHREWFKTHQERYQREVLEPVFGFIRAMKPRLAKISPHFTVEAKKSGGSLMRIHRDIRFSKDKTPFHTFIGIHFYHQQGKRITAPGFYTHIAPGELFLGIGVWHPDSAALGRIRTLIHREPADWTRARDDRRFRQWFELAGDRLTSPPRGYPRDHPLLDDLKRKDFTGVRKLSPAELYQPGFPDRSAEAFHRSAPLMGFLCRALQVPF